MKELIIQNHYPDFWNPLEHPNPSPSWLVLQDVIKIMVYLLSSFKSRVQAHLLSTQKGRPGPWENNHGSESNGLILLDPEVSPPWAWHSAALLLEPHVLILLSDPPSRTAYLLAFGSLQIYNLLLRFYFSLFFFYFLFYFLLGQSTLHLHHVLKKKELIVSSGQVGCFCTCKFESLKAQGTERGIAHPGRDCGTKRGG